jgi:hypothetical protein
MEMIQEGELVVDLDNDVVGPACLTHDGEVHNARVREQLGLPPLVETPPADGPPTPSDEPETPQEAS